MSKPKTTIEQLRQELLSQDPSLAGKKQEYIGLLSRMSEHVPQVELNPQFAKNLKNNLRYHLISQYEPAPALNLWQKFMLYGFPTLAIGVALIYVLPMIPLSEHRPLSDTPAFTDQGLLENNTSFSHEGVNNDNITERAVADVSPDMMQKTRQIEPVARHTPTENSSLSQDAGAQKDIVPSMATIPMGGDTIQMKGQSNYTNSSIGKNRKIEYNLSYDVNDTDYVHGNFSDGLLTIFSCEDKQFTLYNATSLSRGPNLWAVEAFALGSQENVSHFITLTIIDNEITTIDGIEKLCK